MLESAVAVQSAMADMEARGHRGADGLMACLRKKQAQTCQNDGLRSSPDRSFATTLTAAGLAPLEAEDLALALRVPSVEAIQCVVSGR